MNWLVASIFFFLAISIWLYVMLAGADFGAGILEIFVGKKRSHDQREIISRAMAPVWEANHVWLILAVVILFVAFPRMYEYLSVYLHIPLMAILMGIVARGCAFTFRHYDTLSSEYYLLYSRIFSLSSLWTAFFLGVSAGALILGRIDINATDYPGLYISPWLNTFCVWMGIFTCCLFSLLASIYLTGEARDNEMKNIFRKRALVTNIILIPIGAIVFLSAERKGLPLAQNFFANHVSVSCWILASLLLIPFWKKLRATHISFKNIFWVRALGAIIVTLVLVAFYAVQYPVALRFTQNGKLVEFSFQQIAAPPETLRAMLFALIAGSILIFPALYLLLRIFKWESLDKNV